MSKKKKKRSREKVERIPGQFPWEGLHPSRGHRRNALSGKALREKYPLLREVDDPCDNRMPGSFENGKRR